MVVGESLVGRSLIRLQELPRRNGVEIDIFTTEDQTEISLHSMCVPENNSENWGRHGEMGRIISCTG